MAPAALPDHRAGEHLARGALAGVGAYGAASLLLMALCSLALQAFGRARGAAPAGRKDSLPVHAGAAAAAFVLAALLASLHGRAGGPEWPQAAWFVDLELAALLAVASGWGAARIVRACAGAARPRLALGACALAPMIVLLGLALPALLSAGGDRAAGAAPPAGQGSPDILVVVVDSLRADALSCYGGEGAPTPALDALARDGAMLLDATAAAPGTEASTASLLTSRLPSAHGITGKTGILGEALPTLAEALRARGYRTLALVSRGGRLRGAGLGRGFDLWREEPDPRTQATHAYLLSSRLLAAFGWQRRLASPPASEMIDRALEQLSARRERPRFVFLGLSDPREPYSPPEDLRRRVDAEAPGRIEFGESTHSEILRGEIVLNEEELRRTRALYRAEVSAVDRELGRLLEALRAQIEAGEVLIVFTSNHGEELMEHGSMGSGHALYQEIVHVPVIVSRPGTVPAGRAVTEPVSLLGLGPTILELAGLPAEPSFEGRSLAPLIAGRSQADPEPVVSEMNAIGSEFTLHWSRAARWGDWKVILSATDILRLGPLRREVYDLGSDPGEKESLAEIPAEAASLEGWLRDFISRTAPAPGGSAAPASRQGSAR